MAERIRLLIRTDIKILWRSTKKFSWRNWRGRQQRRSRKGVLIFGRGGVLLVRKQLSVRQLQSGWRLGKADFVRQLLSGNLSRRSDSHSAFARTHSSVRRSFTD